MEGNVLGNNPFDRKKKDSIWKNTSTVVSSSGIEYALCAAKTLSGRPCRNRAEPGSKYCAVHKRILEVAGEGEHSCRVEPVSPQEKTASLSENLNKMDDSLEGKIQEIQEIQETETKDANPKGNEEKIGSHHLDKVWKASGQHEARLEDNNGSRAREELKKIFLRAFEDARSTFPGMNEGEMLELMSDILSVRSGKRISGLTLLGSVEKNLVSVISAIPVKKLLEIIVSSGSELLDETTKSIKALMAILVTLWNPARNENIDEFGFDEEFTERIAPIFDFMYTRYWRVKTTGMENVPGKGRALLVANHSGVIPWDATMITMAIMREHPNHRHLRCLMLDLFSTMPFLSIFFVRTGQLRACPENGTQLLNRDHLVAVFPEGLKGIGKLYSKRYQLQRFGRGGFIKLALNADAPIIPVSVVGGEEIYPLIYRADWLANLFDFPYFPITLTFPWFGLLGLIPLPSRWYIEFGKPIDYSMYGKAAMEDDVLVNALSNEVKDTLQEMIYDRLKKRNSIFF